MFDAILGFLENVVSSIIPGILKKKGPSEQKKNYEELRREIAEALSMYACCFHNPIDLADTHDHRLPPIYDEGSHKCRVLASKLKGFAETMPNGKTDLPVSIDEINDAAGCLFGISNSFQTPYRMGRSSDDRKNVERYEDKLRKILALRQRY